MQDIVIQDLSAEEIEFVEGGVIWLAAGALLYGTAEGLAIGLTIGVLLL